jgi:hypothetical protein
VLARNVERLPTGSQDSQLRTRPQERVHNYCTRVGEVFAVVEQEEQAAVCKVAAEYAWGPALRTALEIKSLRNGRREEVVLSYRDDVDEPHAVLEGATDLPGGSQSQPGLPYSSHSGKGYQARRGQRLLDVRNLALSADETGQIRWEVARDSLRR